MFFYIPGTEHQIRLLKQNLSVANPIGKNPNLRELVLCCGSGSVGLGRSGSKRAKIPKNKRKIKIYEFGSIALL
jgi:hypothetical protein